jgi:hypothetical protein
MSITGDNLQDGLWKEMAVWYGRAPLLQAAFEMKGERIVPRNAPRDVEDRWFVSARSFPQKPDKEQQAASVAGLHSQNVAVVIDESGDVPPGVLAAAEGIHANDVHSLVLLTGNCTSMEGALYDATVKRAHRYHVIKVTGDPDDPERSTRMDLEYCRQLIADYGRNDPVVMINVLGEFPPTGIAKLLGPADIEKAVKREIPDPGLRAGRQGRRARHRAAGPRLERLHAAAGTGALRAAGLAHPGPDAAGRPGRDALGRRTSPTRWSCWRPASAGAWSTGCAARVTAT